MEKWNSRLAHPTHITFSGHAESLLDSDADSQKAPLRDATSPTPYLYQGHLTALISNYKLYNLFLQSLCVFPRLDYCYRPNHSLCSFR